MQSKKRTGREAIDRIIWDDRLDPTAFVVGYSDRLAESGFREVPLLDWKDGEIPDHRISYIHCGAIIVWRRGAASDRLADADLPAAAWIGGAPPAQT